MRAQQMTRAVVLAAICSGATSSLRLASTAGLSRLWPSAGRAPVTMALRGPGADAGGAAAGGGDGEVDMDVLSKRISGLEMSSIFDQVLIFDASRQEESEIPLRMVYILIFNEGSQHEGVYSIRLERGSQTPSKNVVLAWEMQADAAQYGQLLLGQHMPESSPRVFSVAEISAFCADADVLLGIVRDGCWVDPPSRTVEKFDWVLSDEADGGEAPTRETDGSLSGEQLDQMRKQLERLSRMSSGE